MLAASCIKYKKSQTFAKILILSCNPFDWDILSHTERLHIRLVAVTKTALQMSLVKGSKCKG